MAALLADPEDTRWLLEELRSDCRKAVRAGLYRIAWDEGVVQRRLKLGIQVGEEIPMPPMTWIYLGRQMLRIARLTDGTVTRNGRPQQIEVDGHTLPLTPALTKEFMRRACYCDLARAADQRRSTWPTHYHHPKY